MQTPYPDLSPQEDPSAPTQPVRPAPQPEVPPGPQPAPEPEDAEPAPQPPPEEPPFELLEPPALDPLSTYQPIQKQPPAAKKPRREEPKPRYRPRRRPMGCCGVILLGLLVLFAAAAVYFLFPFKTRVLLLGVDRAADGSYTGRTDTIILLQVNPLKPDVRMLSIPRDLWVPIPGVGENRINTAHFFAEAAEPGSGPRAVMDVIRANFGVGVGYYARVRFDGFAGVIDALGGVTINLDAPMGGLDAGRHHLDGAQALAFARDRKGTDDFFRMNQGQYILIATARQALNPLTWPRLPAAAAAFFNAVDTNLPSWEWPRLGLALLRGGLDGIDHRTITREMVTPYLTEGGAQVLLPNWDAIRPLVAEMFGN